MPTTAMCLLVSQNGQLLVAVVADDQPMTELLTATATQSLAVLIAGDDSIARAASAAAGAARRRRRRASSPAAAAAAPPPGLGRGGSLQSLRFPLRFRLCIIMIRTEDEMGISVWESQPPPRFLS
jgi:hypothetical protein